MKDQVDNLKKDIKALALTGGISWEETGQLIDNCMYGDINFYMYLQKDYNKIGY